ncbi:hypothetical protein CL620_03275, partial [archaeon]|nr:hypothetical protein [archaeon]
MKTKDRDPASYFSIIDSFLQKAELTEQQYTMLTTELKRFLSNKFDQNGYVHPIITKFCTDWYREFYSLIGGQDPYKHLKEKSNDEANKILPTLQINSFHDALKVAVKGNQLDYGSVLVLNPDLTKLQEEFTRVHELEFTIDHSKELDDAINNAGTILFLPDNAGEIIFDIPLLKYL